MLFVQKINIHLSLNCNFSGMRPLEGMDKGSKKRTSRNVLVSIRLNTPVFFFCSIFIDLDAQYRKCK